MRVLSIRQPWAKLVVIGWKPVEYRSWSTEYRGPVAIHAARTLDQPLDILTREYGPAFVRDLPVGVIVGIVELVDVIEYGERDYGFVLRKPRRIEPVRCTGERGLHVLPANLVRQVQAALAA
jgi:hypothetical protein